MKKEYKITDFLHGLVPESKELPTKVHRLPMKKLDEVRMEAVQHLRKPDCNEIRFIMEDREGEFVFELGENGGIIEVYFGDYLEKIMNLAEGIHEICIQQPNTIKELGDEYREMGFSVEAVRFVIAAQDFTVITIPDNIRPVTKELLPKYSYVAYGTSITQGVDSTYPSMTYARQLARNLQCDVINLGVSGNAFCEETIADYIGNELSWDFMTCCVSVNMLNQGETHLAFKEKIYRFLSIILENNPNKVIFCISVFPYLVDLGLSNNKILKSTPDEYRTVLKEVVDSLNKNNNLIYVHGPEVLRNKRGLSCDFLHPNDFGHTEIARNLSKIIRKRMNWENAQ